MKARPTTQLDTTQPFRAADARIAGISRRQLDGPRFTRLFRGVYVASSTPLDLATRLRAARLVLPPDAVVSHVSAMRLHGFDAGRDRRLHLSTNFPLTSRHEGIVLHRRQGMLHPSFVLGLPVTGPDRTFVDVALRLGLVDLVAFGDHLVHRGLTTPEDLRDYAEERHLNGVQRARRVSRRVRRGAESPRETRSRLMLLFARLPDPELNVDVHDEHGQFLGRGDMVYRRWRVVVEYDGKHHLRDAATWQRDLRRREAFEAAGWTYIVITDADMAVPASVPSRVHRALHANGYRGPAPVLSSEWSRWFRA